MSYKILWYSMPALHDNSNGAAIHNKILLEALAARGIQVKVLNALVADDPRGLEIFNRIGAQVNHDPKSPYLQFTDNNVEYVIVKTQGRICNDVTGADQGKIFDLFVQFLEKFQPDVLMGYSGDIFSAYLRHEAHTRGIPVVYALCNGLHRSFGFADCDLVFTPSQATAAMYRESDDIDIKATGQFIDVNKVVALDRTPETAKYVTFINPTPEKGLAIFVKISEVFARKHPEIRFLAVKSVGDYNRILSGLHNADGTPYFQPGQTMLTNVDVAEHTDDVRLVYKATRVLLAPSVWHEAWGCVATEANFNNIPVIASKSGGLPEAVREGGVLLDAPECTQRDYSCVPTEEEVAPWVEALEKMLQEDWTERCQKAAAANSLDASVDNLMVYLQPLLEQGRAQKKPLEKSCFFSDATMRKRKAYYVGQGMVIDGDQSEPAAEAPKPSSVKEAAANAPAAANESYSDPAAAPAPDTKDEAIDAADEAAQTPEKAPAKKPASRSRSTSTKSSAKSSTRSSTRTAAAKTTAKKTTGTAAKKTAAKKPAARKTESKSE